MVKYILVIKGVDELEYQAIRDDLVRQYEAKGMEVPIFTHLPQDYAEIELVWIDEEMEKESTRLALENIKTAIPTPANEISSVSTGRT